MSFLQVESLAKYYGSRTIFRNLSLSLDAGECLVLQGSNGAGKSTLLSCIAGVLAYDEGSVQIAGHNPWQSFGYSKLLRQVGVGYLPQKNLLYPALLVSENIRLFAHLAQVAKPRQQRVVEALGLESCWSQRLDQCSQGIARRVGIARAVLTGRRLLVLDEPFANLDSETISAATELLATVQRNGACIVLASHQTDMLTQLQTHLLELPLAGQLSSVHTAKESPRSDPLEHIKHSQSSPVIKDTMRGKG